MAKKAVVFFALVAAFAVNADTITCGGDGPSHLQGVACDGTSIYWSFTTRLVNNSSAGCVPAFFS